MLSRFRHVFGVVFFLLVASCSGGGCSGCSNGCGGTTPLPGGFPKDKAVQNAASVRVSRPGLDFVESNLPAVVSKMTNAPGGVLGFDIPNTNPPKTQIANLGIGKLLIDPDVCPGGPDPKATPPKCHAAVGIGASTFQIDSITPNAVRVNAVIPVELEDTPITAELRADPIIGGEFGIGSLTLHVGYGNGGCSNGKPNVTPHALPVSITIPLVEETISPRDGYTKIDVANAQIDLSGLNENDVHVCSSCGFATDICSAVTDSGFVKGLVVGPLKSGLADQVKGLLADQLCTAPNAALNPPCPTGSKPDGANKHCVYVSKPDTCVPTLLGTDAHVDLSGALKSISPSTAGGLDFGLASAGAMQPFPKGPILISGRSPNGITLGMMGGVLPQPPSKCVPQADIKPPTGIPLPDELAPTTADPATAPHVGIALAGRFLDYSLGSVYNSGLLCLGVSSEQVDMLKSGLLSLIIPSIKTLTFEQTDAAAAIATRPQAPPRVKVGGGTNVNTDPLLTIQLEKFAIDFYIWSYDRFVRAFTFTGDVTVPLNLQVAKGANGKGAGIQPTIGDLKVANATVTNADLIMDDPGMVAAALGGLLGGLGKQLVGGGISPFDISSALGSFGLGLDVTSIKKLTKDKDDFVGIFANLSKDAGKATVESDTRAKLVSKTVGAEKMQLGTLDKSAAELVVDATSALDDGRHAIEYSWRIDAGTRSPWSSDRHIVIQDDQLLLQGKHVLYVSSRLAGEAETEDATPAEVPFVIDALAPFVKLDREGGVVKVTAWDLVSDKDKLLGRVRLGDDAFGEWVPVSDLARIDVARADSIEVEVKDEEGNVRSVQQGLRGKADGTLAASGSGCGCSMPGKSDTTNGTIAAVLGVALLGFLGLRRRSQGASKSIKHAAMAIGAIGAVAATSQGCACGSEAEGDEGDLSQKCGPTCDQPCKESLPLGLPGSYTSIAKAKDGAIWVAGYNDALLDQGDSMLWGDLVVGKYDLGKQRVDWKTVDGIPLRDQAKDGCAERAKNSWRNGESDSGDDVGLWTSIQVSTEGPPMVSYYDATNHRLKFAFEDNGWHTFVLREVPNGDAGRYSKMLIVGDKPQIAFLQMEPGNNGKTRSKVVIAKSRVPTPRGADAFDFEDAAVEEDNPCRAGTCGGGQVCAKAEGVCMATTGGCTPADCGAGKACAVKDGKATCVATLGSIETYPNVFGAFVSFAQNGSNLGIAVYDRPHGNLVALVNNGGKWDRVIVDGETGDRAKKTAIDTGDTGIATSLAIDNAGTWHLSYVNGLDETLRYVTFSGGKPGKSQIVDDGSGVDGKPFPDGTHVVGDDSSIRVDGDIVTIYYQDATTGTLRRANGTPSGATRKWDLRTIPQPNRFAGFFPQVLPGEDKVANWWRQTDHGAKSVSGDVSILSP
jgi:MYXO-CTERM domain-containing protein